MISTLLILITAAVHFYFTFLEMARWEAPRTRKVFGTTPEFAAQSRVMAANQGLYNAFIGAGLLVALAAGAPLMLYYLLLCAVVAGAYAFYCGIKPALYVQSLPALLALLAHLTGL